MTWTAATTPDEVAQQGDSLVASILRRSQPSLNDLQIGSSEPAVVVVYEDHPAVTPQRCSWDLDQAALEAFVTRQRLRMGLNGQMR